MTRGRGERDPGSCCVARRSDRRSASPLADPHMRSSHVCAPTRPERPHRVTKMHQNVSSGSRESAGRKKPARLGCGPACASGEEALL